YSDSGFLDFFGGFFALTVAPLDPFFWVFSLPLIAAVVGLIYQRRPGWMGSLGALICGLVGPFCLGSAYVLDNSKPFAYGYCAVEACFLMASLAYAVSL